MVTLEEFLGVKERKLDPLFLDPKPPELLTRFGQTKSLGKEIVQSPQPSPFQRLTNFLKPQGSAPKLAEKLKEFGRIFTREGAGLVAEVIDRPIKPQTKLEAFLFGIDPVQLLSVQGEETLKDFGVSEENAKKFGLLTGGIFLGIDLLPPTRAVRLSKLLAKSNNVDESTKLLKQNGIGETTAQQFAKKTIKINDPKTIEVMLKAKPKTLDSVKRTTKVKPQQKRIVGGLKSKIEEGVLKRDILREEIKRTPAQKLARFVSRTTGELPEVTGKGGKFSKSGDALAADLGFRDSEEARRAFEKLTRLKEREKILAEDVRRLKSEKVESNKLISALRNQTSERKALVRAIDEVYGLEKKDIDRVAGGRDFRQLSQPSFNNFIENLEKEGLKIAERRAARVQLEGTIFQKELIKVENLQKAYKLPTIQKMNTQQLKEFDEILQRYKTGDEFLTVRKIETVEKTDLKGIRTIREAKERLAGELGVKTKDLDSINVDQLDRFRFDTALAEKNPFYGLLVDTTNAGLLNAEARYLNIEKRINELIGSARKSRKRGITERLISQDKKIFKYLETPDAQKSNLAKSMTKEELEAARFIRNKYTEVRDYLVQMETLKKYRSDYITHIRRGFLEEWKETNLLNAFKGVFEQYRQDQAVFNIIDDTGNILPLEKFFKFSMKRTGELKPTENVARAFLAYMNAFEKKVALDSLVPKLDIYTHSLTPKVKTPRGLEFDRSLKTFVNEFLNTKKGRVAKIVGIEQGGKIDIILRAGKAFTVLLDLGLNIPVGIAARGGENITTFTLLGVKDYTKGLLRTRTGQGKFIIDKYKNFVGRTPFDEIWDASKTLPEKFTTGLLGLFRDATVRANKTFLLGSLSDVEFKSGTITTQRLTELKRELGRYRVTDGSQSVFGATSIGGTLKQYRTWVIPPLRTVTKNLTTIALGIKSGKLPKREAQELLRGAVATLMTVFLVKAVIGIDENDKSFTGQLLNKAYRDTLTLAGALNPKTITGEPRMLSFVADVGEAIGDILTLEKLKSGELKGVGELERALTPRLIKQFIPSEKEKSVSSGGTFPKLPQLPRLPKLPSI